MAYQHHVFISYKSKSREWLLKVFMPPFQHFLEEEIGSHCKVFVDWHDIQTGDAWRPRLHQGLAHSHCLIALLLPSYFESDWCTKEFAVFEHRSRVNGMLSDDDPGSLIIPVALHAATRFPDAVKDGFQVNLSLQRFYTTNSKGFRRRKDYPDFEHEIKRLAEMVGEKVKRLPNWDPRWKETEWIERPVNHLKINPQPLPQPLLL